MKNFENMGKTWLIGVKSFAWQGGEGPKHQFRSPHKNYKSMRRPRPEACKASIATALAHVALCANVAGESKAPNGSFGTQYKKFGKATARGMEGIPHSFSQVPGQR